MRDQIKKEYLWFFLFLSVVIAIVYACTLYFQFVFDDEAFVVKNCYIKNLEFLPKIMGTGAFVFARDGASGYYRPLQIFSYMIDYMFYGLDPFGYHLSNILIFCAACFSLFLFLNEVFDKREIAYIVSLLFSVSPFLLANTAYVSGRGDLFVYLFFFLGLYWTVKMFKGQGEKFGFFACFMFLMVLFTKASAVLFPLFVLAAFFSVKRKISRKKAAIFFSVLFVMAAVFFFNKMLYNQEFAAKMNAGYAKGFFGNIMDCFRVLKAYLAILFFPKDLYFFRILPEVQGIAFSDLILFFVSVFVFLFAAFRVIMKKNRVLLFSILWFFVSIIPFFKYIHLFGVQEVAMLEHWFGFSAISVFIVMVYLVCKVFPKKRTLRALIYAALILYYAFFISRNIGMWENNDTIRNKTNTFYVEQNRSNVTTIGNKGAQALERKDFDKAGQIFSQLIAEGNTRNSIVQNMMVVWAQTGQYEKAENFIKGLSPMNEVHYYLLGQVYLKQGKLKKAHEAFLEALNRDPEYVEVWLVLGTMFYNAKAYDKALTCYQRGKHLDPDHEDIDLNLAHAYLENNDLEASVRCFKRGYEKYPNDKRTYDLYKKIKERTEVF